MGNQKPLTMDMQHDFQMKLFQFNFIYNQLFLLTLNIYNVYGNTRLNKQNKNKTKQDTKTN